MISIADAVLALDATAQISTVSNDANDIIWHDSNPNSITVLRFKQNRQNYKRHMMQRLMPELGLLHTHQLATN